MIVEMRDGWLLPVFRYNENIVRLIKTITGRSFDRSTKRWFIPCYHVVETMEKLGRIGFSFRSEVHEYKAQLLAHRQNIERAKENESAYAGSYGAVLRPYQKKGVAFLRVAGRALLADQMGLGKTLQVIAACEDSQRTLVLCPASNKYGWKEEIKKWEPGAGVFVIDGNKKKRVEMYEAALKATGKSYVVANYELLLHDFDWLNRF